MAAVYREPLTRQDTLQARSLQRRPLQPRSLRTLSGVRRRRSLAEHAATARPRSRRFGWLAAFALATLAGCASTIPAQVTTFNQLPPKSELAGRSFAVVAPPGQADSLEFTTYANRVGQALERQGLVPAPDGRVADYAVNIRYSSLPLQTWRERSGPSVGLGVSGGGFSFGGLGVGIGIGIPIGGGGQRTTTVFRHELDVDLSNWGSASAADGAPGAPGVRVFEGKAMADNDSEAITSVMPALIEALFSDFPGANGATRVVDVRLNR